MNAVYSAFILKKEYSMHEFLKMVETYKEFAQEEVCKLLLQYATEDFVVYYNQAKLLQVLGKGTFRDIPYIVRKIMNGELESAFRLCLRHEVKEFEQKEENDSLIKSKQLYSDSTLYFLQDENGKTYMVYEGGSLFPFLRILAKDKNVLEEYNYGNIYYKLKRGISDEEWEERKKTWKSLLGDDLSLNEHSTKITLTEHTNIKNFCKELLLNGSIKIEKQVFKGRIIRKLLGEFSDCILRDTSKFRLLSKEKKAEYIEWHDEKIKIINEHLDLLSVDKFNEFLNSEIFKKELKFLS